MAEWLSDDKLDYLDQFDLDKEPFSPEVDNVSFFQDAAITQRLGMLQHFSRYSDLLLLVVGEHGSGKTTLLKHFVGQLDDSIKVSRVEAGVDMDRDSLLIAVGKGFGLPPILDGNINTFIKQLQELLRFDEGGLLVIDDAHLLPTDTLHYALELAEISGSHGKLLRVILFSEPRIEQVLAEPGLSKLGESITHTLDIPRFDLERTEAYIRHRMAAAGSGGDDLFDKASLKRIHKGSHGNPLRIDELATAHLLEVAGNPEAYRNRPMKRTYLAGIAVLIMVAVAAAVFFYHGTRRPLPTGPIATGTGNNQSVVLPLVNNNSAEPPHLKGWHEQPDSGGPETSAPPVDTVAQNQNPSQAATGTDASSANSQGSPASAPSPATTPGSAAQSAPASSSSSPNADGATPVVSAAPEETPAPVINSVTPKPVIGSPRRQSITIHGTNFDPKAKVSLGWTGKTRELDNWQVRVVGHDKIVFRVITGTQPDTWTVRVVNPANRGSNVFSFPVVSPKSPQATEVTVPKPRAQPTTSDTNWLYARDPQHLTLQVLASRNGLAVANYYKDHSLQDHGHIIAYNKGDQQWYTLVYGDYASHTEADAAAKALADQLKDGKKPWPRSMVGLQQLVLTGRLEGPEWIKVQSGGNYTLQLVAGSSKDTVEAFVGEHKLTGEAAVYQTTHQGKPWYVLVYGVYDNQKQAQAAVATLPPSVQKLKPWARSFGSVQSDIH